MVLLLSGTELLYSSKNLTLPVIRQNSSITKKGIYLSLIPIGSSNLDMWFEGVRH